MKPVKPSFMPGDLETMNKLYLELSLVCDGARTWRDIQYEQEIARLNEELAQLRASRPMSRRRPKHTRRRK